MNKQFIEILIEEQKAKIEIASRMIALFSEVLDSIEETPVEETKVEEKPAPKKRAARKKAPAKKAEPKPEPVKEEKGPTKKEVVTAMQKLAQYQPGGRAAIDDILAEVVESGQPALFKNVPVENLAKALELATTKLTELQSAGPEEEDNDDDEW